MDAFQNSKIVVMLAPQVKNDGDFAGNAAMDLSQALGARVEIFIGATDVAIGSTDEATPLVLEQCDTEGGSYTEITDAVLSAVIAATDDNKNYCIDLDLAKSHKRFLRVKAPHAGAGAAGAYMMILGRIKASQISPNTAAKRGFAEHIIGA